LGYGINLLLWVILEKILEKNYYRIKIRIKLVWGGVINIGDEGIIIIDVYVLGSDYIFGVYVNYFGYFDYRVIGDGDSFIAGWAGEEETTYY